MRVRAQGATRQGAPPEQNGSWRYAPGVPVTQNQTLETKQCRTRRGPTLRARGAPLALTQARGRRDHPLPTSARSPTRASINQRSRKTKQKGKKKNKDKRSTGKPLPPRVPRKRPQKVQGESQKRAGPRMAPREKRREAGRTAKTGETDKSGGTQTRKETRETSACEGCPVTT